MTLSTIITDIEGTTSSIAFVHEVLFPYSSKHLADFVNSNFTEKSLQPIFEAIKEISQQELPTSASVINVLQQWIKTDQKFTPLKQLQGLIWEAGYRSGSLKGHVYADAFKGLKRWKAAGIDLCVYSSGSAHAQKLLFGYSCFGDLNYLFTRNFDTYIGHKRESNSYQNILSELNKPAHEVLFLSDIEAELEAANSTGMQVILLARDYSEPSTRFVTVTNFDQIDEIVAR